MDDKILIVDDEQEIADLVAIYLENEGFTVFKYYNPKEALGCIEEENLDLAVLDIMMPELDGFSACREIRTFDNLHHVLERNARLVYKRYNAVDSFH